MWVCVERAELFYAHLKKNNILFFKNVERKKMRYRKMTIAFVTELTYWQHNRNNACNYAINR